MKKVIMMTVAGSIMLFGACSQKVLKGYDRAYMDETVGPGEDFVKYAAGTWLKNNPIKGEYPISCSWIDLEEQNQKQLQELILQYAENPQEKGSLGQKIGSLYNMMMDSVRLNKEGYDPIKPNLEKIKAIKDIHEYQLVTAQLDFKGEGTMMFSWGVGADMHQADQNIVGISQGGLGLGTRDYYLNDDEQTVRVREAYKTYAHKLFMMVGYDSLVAQRKVDAIMAIETQIAKVSYSVEKQRDLEANYHKMTYNELLRDYPGIEWEMIMKESGFPKLECVDLGQPEPIHEVEKIYASTPLEDLKSYAELRVISGATSCLSDDFRKLSFEFRSVLSGVKEDTPRWKRATGLVNSILSDAIGQMYCEKYFPASSKERALTMVLNLQKALGERIQEATWMSDSTKKQALDKLSGFIIKIGYPDQWRDYSKLDIDDKLSLYENLANISQFMWLDRQIRKIGKPVDKTEWYMSPQTINAYYNPTTNEICFPAAILQPPFFDAEADDANNYGAIGSVIGHEMSHGFDDQGCQFDKTGNMNNWWTDADNANYAERTKVLEDYFNTIEVINGKKVNGKQTLGENIGDNGGLKVALRALHNAGTAAEDIDGFNPDQRFFLSWARIWASNAKPEYVDMLMTMDVHSPNNVRVNGALPQIDEWYDAFGIKETDKLFVPKEKRALVW